MQASVQASLCISVDGVLAVGFAKLEFTRADAGGVVEALDTFQPDTYRASQRGKASNTISGDVPAAIEGLARNMANIEKQVGMIQAVPDMSLKSRRLCKRFT